MHQPSKLNPEVPRRAMIPEWTAAEHTIQAAVDAVERAGAHPLLTDAVILLGQARDKVADFVELPKGTYNPYRAVAKEIARDLFTDGSGKHASRLVMKHGPKDAETDGAGWCESAVADRIAEKLLRTARTAEHGND